jgi:hypothetical protein
MFHLMQEGDLIFAGEVRFWGSSALRFQAGLIAEPYQCALKAEGCK